MGFRIFFRDWNDFAAKTELGIVLEPFSGNEVGLKKFFSEDKREEKLDLKNRRPKKRKGERELD